MTDFRQAFEAICGTRNQAHVTRRRGGGFIISQGNADVELTAVSAVNLARFIARHTGRTPSTEDQ